MKIKKGQYSLNHERYIDDMGFERDSFSLFDEATRTHYPFWGNPKVINKNLEDFPINRIPFEYTTEDYEEMLDEQIQKLKSRE